MKNAAVEEQVLHLIDPKSNHPIQVYFESVTPKLARALLDSNHLSNRKPKLHAIKAYAKAMKSGLWEPASGECIKLTGGVGGAKPVLIDGQHRLLGLLESGIETGVPMMFMSGIPESALHAIDDGITRSLGDSMRINGVKLKGRASSIESGIKMLSLLEVVFKQNVHIDSARKTRHNNSSLMKFYASLPRYNEVCQHYAETFRYNLVEKVIGGSVIYAMYYLSHDLYPDEVFALVKSLETGLPFDDLGVESPIYHVIQKISRDKQQGITVRISRQIDMFIWALEMMIKKERISRCPHTFPKAFESRSDLVRKMKQKLQKL